MITLEKAIEIQSLIAHTPPSGASQDFIDAINLGKEALKRTEARRERLSWKLEPLLPGETTE